MLYVPVLYVHFAQKFLVSPPQQLSFLSLSLSFQTDLFHLRFRCCAFGFFFGDLCSFLVNHGFHLIHPALNVRSTVEKQFGNFRSACLKFRFGQRRTGQDTLLGVRLSTIVVSYRWVFNARLLTSHTVRNL